MRKVTLYILTALMGLLLSGCMKESMVAGYADDRIPISFNCESEGMTRTVITGDVAARDLGNNFIVTGYAKTSAATSMVFDHYNVNYKSGTSHSSVSNTSGWEYVGQTPSYLSNASTQEIKYWDNAATYYFVAFSKGEGNAEFTRVDNSCIGNGDSIPSVSNSVFEITGNIYDIEGAYYSNLVVVENPNSQITVKPQFKHLGAKLRLALYESIPGYSVCDVKFYRDDSTLPTDGSEKNPTIYQSEETFPADNSTVTVYVTYPSFSNKGAAYVSNPDVSSRTKYLSFNCGIQLFTKENKETVNDTVFIGRSAANASYSVLAIDVPATSSPLPISLKVDYTLVPTDGAGERIHVRGAKASVPAAFTQWTTNSMYTYIFRISDNTSGSTGGDISGLYPISFEAMSVSGFDGSQQETQYEPECPILAYQKDAVVNSDNETMYKVGRIYAVVYDNDGNTVELTPGSGQNGNIRLFKAVLSDAADARAITASIASACFNAGSSNYEYATGKYVSLTNIDNSLTVKTSIPAADSHTGSAINVNGAVFNAEQGTVYVLQYKDAQGRYVYKVLRTLYYIPYKALDEDIYDESADYFGIYDNIGWGASFLDAEDNVIEVMETMSRAASSKQGDYYTGTMIFDKPVVSITASMFDYTPLADITLPNTLKRIEDGGGTEGVFSSTQLTSIVLPVSMEYVGGDAFFYDNDMSYGIKTLICLGTKPPEIGKINDLPTIWGNQRCPSDDFKLYVPEEAVDDYSKEWGNVVVDLIRKDTIGEILLLKNLPDELKNDVKAKYPEVKDLYPNIFN